MRIRFVFIILVLIWAVLLARIYYLSIKSNTYYEELANRNIIKTEPLIPIRGLILDRHGEPLAVNRLGFSIALPPKLSVRSKRAELEQSIESVSSYFSELNATKLLESYLKQDSPYNHDHIKIVDFISYEDMHSIFPKLSQNRTIRIVPATKRFYPNNETASHLIGYTGKANRKDIAGNKVAKLAGSIGKNGLESRYNGFLQGEAGYKKIKVTALNKEIGEVEKKPPVEDRNLVLSVDLRVQKFIDSIIGEKNGAVIVMDAHNGGIIAAGSYPEYDINKFVDGISQGDWDKLINNIYHPFTNKITSGLYPPGSTIKMGVALSYLEYGDMSPEDEFYCTGAFDFGNREFRCWKDTGHGKTDMNKAIRESCDDYFYKGSLRAGIKNISKVMRQMGFGEKTGIDLPNEFIGVVPSRDWKRRRYNKPWYQGETLVSSIGQGYFLVTPLQMARYTALLATGKLPTPHLVARMGEQRVEYSREDVLNPFQKSHLDAIRDAMYEVTNHERGTAYWHVQTKSKYGIELSSKTGTAQVVSIPQGVKERMKEEDMEYFHRSHAWLTGFMPANNPKYVITAMIEHGGHGGDAAGGIVTEVVGEMKRLGYFAMEQSKE